MQQKERFGQFLCEVIMTYIRATIPDLPRSLKKLTGKCLQNASL